MKNWLQIYTYFFQEMKFPLGIYRHIPFNNIIDQENVNSPSIVYKTYNKLEQLVKYPNKIDDPVYLVRNLHWPQEMYVYFCQLCEYQDGYLGILIHKIFQHVFGFVINEHPDKFSTYLQFLYEEVADSLNCCLASGIVRLCRALCVLGPEFAFDFSPLEYAANYARYVLGKERHFLRCIIDVERYALNIPNFPMYEMGPLLLAVSNQLGIIDQEEELDIGCEIIIGPIINKYLHPDWRIPDLIPEEWNTRNEYLVLQGMEDLVL